MNPKGFLFWSRLSLLSHYNLHHSKILIHHYFLNHLTVINKQQLISALRNPLSVFLVKGFVFFLLWDQLLYNYLVTPEIHNWVIYRLLDVSRFFLKGLYPDAMVKDFDIYLGGRDCVHVGIPCNGLDVMGVFACLILAYQSRWFHKAWMIVAGMGIIFLMNAIRVSLLAALVLENQKAFDINHKYIFNFVLYGILLLIFSVWSSKFGTKPKPPVDGMSASQPL